MVKYFLDGGGFMWPILICGVVGIAFAIERLYHLLKSNIIQMSYGLVEVDLEIMNYGMK